LVASSCRALFQCCHMSHAVIINCFNDSTIHCLLDLWDLHVFQYLICSSCHFWDMTPSSMLFHPSKACSTAAPDFHQISLALCELPICHCHRPCIILCLRSGAVLIAFNQSLSDSNALSQLLVAVGSWHHVICSLFSSSWWHHGHWSSVLSFHHFMFFPYGRKFAAAFYTHFLCIAGRFQIASLAVSQSTMCVCRLLNFPFCSQCSCMAMLLMWCHILVCR